MGELLNPCSTTSVLLPFWAILGCQRTHSNLPSVNLMSSNCNLPSQSQLGATSSDILKAPKNVKENAILKSSNSKPIKQSLTCIVPKCNNISYDAGCLLSLTVQPLQNPRTACLTRKHLVQSCSPHTLNQKANCD